MSHNGASNIWRTDAQVLALTGQKSFGTSITGKKAAPDMFHLCVAVKNLTKAFVVREAMQPHFRKSELRDLFRLAAPKTYLRVGHEDL